MSYDQQLADALREIARLKELLLTPEEAQEIRDVLWHEAEFREDGTIREKLRLLSDSERKP